MKLRWKITLAVAVLALALAGISLSMMRVEPQKEVDVYRNSLIAAGEKLEISEVSPPPVPREQNGADIVTEAAGLFTQDTYNDRTNLPPAMRMIAPGKAIVCFLQPDVRDWDFTNSWTNVLADAEENRAGTELLRQLMNFPALDFYLDYSQGLGLRAQQFDPLTFCSERLSAEAICDLHNGDAASATTNLCVMLALINGEQGERLPNIQDIRTMITFLAVNVSWNLLQSTNVNDAELAMLQKRWEQLEYLRAMENTLLMQRAMDESAIKKMRASGEYFNTLVGRRGNWDFSGDWQDDWHNLSGNLEWEYGKVMMRASWTYSDELQMLKNYQMILQTIQTIETNAFFNPAYSNLAVRLDALETSYGSSDLEDLRWMFSEDSVGRGTDLAETMMNETSRRIVAAAVALKRYQLKYGKYPSDLNALVPEFVSSVPLDPVDGRPLRYRPNADGTFLLYSIGPNGVDDGGNPTTGTYGSDPGYSWPDRNALDWVWPQPASPAEIEYFYAHPPK